MHRAAVLLAALWLSACATTPFAGNAVFTAPETHAGEPVRFCGRIGEDGLFRSEDNSGTALVIADRGPVNPGFTGGICVEGMVGEDAESVAILRVLHEGS